MKISVIRPTELGSAERAIWRGLQERNTVLASPSFSFEFIAAAGHARPDVRVAVLEQEGKVVGFFPYQQRWSKGAPAGGNMSDHHGVIAAPGTRIDWSALLRAARLSYWKFDHLAAWQDPGVAVTHCNSPGLDLSQGFAAYQQRKGETSNVLAKLPKTARKLERELGPLRFELSSRDDAVFRYVLQLKSEQCRRTGADDFFSWGWPRELVERIRAADDPAFGGRLSALYAGDTLLAAHFGMRSRTVWNWWFPVYNAEHAAHSPGLLLLMKVAEGAAAEGHALLDLGKGDEPYKTRFADCSTPLLEGIVCRQTPVTLARQVRRSVRAWMQESPLVQRLRRSDGGGGQASAISST